MDVSESISQEANTATDEPSREHVPYTDKYFTGRFKLDVLQKENDFCVLTHSNRISVITLAESHPILKNNKKVTNVDYQVDKNTNRLQNKVIGKGKRGGQQLSKTAVLARIQCDDGTEYPVCACLRGTLIEVNEHLVEQPQLITQKPLTDGYVGIILTRLQDHEAEVGKLLSKEKYQEAMESRKQETTMAS